jgi:hypothetical protein
MPARPGETSNFCQKPQFAGKNATRMQSTTCIASLGRQVASSPAVSKTSPDYQQMFVTMLTAIFSMAPCVGENGFMRGVPEETKNGMVQSILAECSARLGPDSDEEEVRLMFQTKTEEVKQLAKQVTIRKMIFAIFSKFRLARVAAGSCCDDPSDCHLMMPRDD